MSNKNTLPTTEPALFRKKSIVLAAGGTGGHLFPALALAEEFENAAIDVHLKSSTYQTLILISFLQ